jgi:hypothetical protein
VISAESIKPIVEAGKPKPQDAGNIFKIADSNAPRGNEVFEKSEKHPDVPDRYKISDSKEVPPKDTVEQQEKTQDIPDRYKISDMKESWSLTDEDRKKIKEESGWSDEVVDNIRSLKEYEVYKKVGKEAGLVEVKINGRECLIRNDIDWGQKDDLGLTNKERVERNNSPRGKDGATIELHHIGQKADSPFVELKMKEHRTGVNDGILHDKTMESEVHNEENEPKYQQERKEHWKIRAEQA